MSAINAQQSVRAMLDFTIIWLQILFELTTSTKGYRGRKGDSGSKELSDVQRGIGLSEYVQSTPDLKKK